MLTSTHIQLIRRTAIASLIFLTAACSTRQSTPIAAAPKPAASISPAPQPQKTVTPVVAAKIDPLESAEDKAISAANLASNASTVEDWDLVKSKLQQAIALTKTVPANSPKRAIARKRQAIYQQRLKVAQQQSQKLARGNATALASTKGEPSEVTATGTVPIISGGASLENYDRVEFGMSPDEVRSLLGRPTRQDGNPPDFSWTWESSDKKSMVGIGFSENKVAGKVRNTNH